MDSLFTALRTQLQAIYSEGEARAIAFMVLDEGFGVSRTDIYADKVRQFSEDEHKRFNRMCKRLAKGEPVQYVLGHAWFAGRPFIVTPDVLIPRPETEELVGWAIEVAQTLLKQQPNKHLRIVDAGTGSGCIAVSLKLALPQAEVAAWDISKGALAVAQQNAHTLGVDVNFEQRDLLQPWHLPAQSIDLIVSNPPYICENEAEHMEQNVINHEPHTALFVPNADPLRFYHALAQGAAQTLTKGGALLTEINRAFAQETADAFAQAGLQDAEVRRDVFGNERMVGAFAGL